MGSVEVQHYLGRARDFFKGMDLLKDDLAEYGWSSALLGIHSAISYCDALRIGLGSMTLSSDNHQEASGDLRRLLSSRRSETGGISHLEKLLGFKSRIAYASESSTENQIKGIIQQAQRFALWVERIGKQLGIEGWEDA